MVSFPLVPDALTDLLKCITIIHHYDSSILVTTPLCSHNYVLHSTDEEERYRDLSRSHTQMRGESRTPGTSPGPKARDLASRGPHTCDIVLSPMMTGSLLSREAVGAVCACCVYLSPYSFRNEWQRTPVFLPGESQGLGTLVGCCLWGSSELDTTEAT